MNVNELEQAIRNLIASQPNIMKSEAASVINSVLSVVYSHKEMVFKIQNHPYQDALKVNMLNQLAGQENTLAISVCQILQDRGINLMLYAPTNQFSPNMYAGATYQMGQMPAFGQANNFAQTNAANNQGFVQNQTKEIQQEAYREDYAEDEAEEVEEQMQEEPETEDDIEENIQEAAEEEVQEELEEQTQEKPAQNNAKWSELEFNDGAKIQNSEPKTEESATSSSGRDYLMELLRK